MNVWAVVVFIRQFSCSTMEIPPLNCFIHLLCREAHSNPSLGVTHLTLILHFYKVSIFKIVINKKRMKYFENCLNRYCTNTESMDVWVIFWIVSKNMMSQRVQHFFGFWLNMNESWLQITAAFSRRHHTISNLFVHFRLIH